MKCSRRHRFLTDMSDITNDDEAIRALLANGPTIAMIGASADPSRDSNRVFAYL